MRPMRRGVRPLTWPTALTALALLAATTAQAQAQALATAPAPSAPVVRDEASPEEVTWALEIEAPEPLRALLQRHLDLSRYLASPETAQVPRTELMRLRQAAPAQARALLETEGRFGATVRTEATDHGERVPVVPGGPALPKIQLRLIVDPGPQTRVESARIEFEGALSLAADAGEARAQELQRQARESWALGPGQPFTQDGWSSAKGTTLALLRAQGHATAAWSGTVAQVDAAQAQARLFLVADSGPLYRFGEIRYEGLDHVRVDAVQALENFAPGDPLREQTLQEFQARLGRSSLFDTVAVQMEPDPALAEAMPVTVRLRERPLQQATLGLGVSDASGPRITLEHQHQRWFGWGWQARTRLQLAHTDRLAALDLTSHPHPGPYRNVAAALAQHAEASGLAVTTQSARLGRSKDDERLERLYYLEWQRVRTRVIDDGSVNDDTTALSLNVQWIWRDLDNALLPTRGTSLSLLTGAGQSYRATPRETGAFARATGRLTRYERLGPWYASARVQLGQVFARDAVAVPYTLLFRAGGDDSVRGYGSQDLGPVDADGAAVGGRVLAVASVEAGHPLRRGDPAFQGAVFVDAGNAEASWKGFNPLLGYGVGLRWRSPVGALRLDLAYGQQARRLRLHFSLGITY